VQNTDRAVESRIVAGDHRNGEAASVYEWATETARHNPMLVIGGAVAIGAIAALALSSRREPPQSNVRQLESHLRRQLVSAEKALKKSVRDIRRSDVGTGLSELPEVVASRLGSMDTSQLEALAHSARRMLDNVAARVSGAVR
jgi:hypothetical protein